MPDFELEKSLKIKQARKCNFYYFYDNFFLP
jgi:hypothetical protein